MILLDNFVKHPKKDEQQFYTFFSRKEKRRKQFSTNVMKPVVG